jgi:large subunit ribosomal protein L32
MANPKRKQSKRRSANRRAGNAYIAPEFAKDPTDGSAFRPHRVNPKNGHVPRPPGPQRRGLSPFLRIAFRRHRDGQSPFRRHRAHCG